MSHTVLTNSLWDDPTVAAPDGRARPAAIAENSLGELFYHTASAKGPAPFCRYRVLPDRKYSELSWFEASIRVAATAQLLRERLQLKPGDRAAILSGTRFEWALSDIAIMSLGAVTVPLYPTSSLDELRFILAETKACVVFAENNEQVSRLHQIETQIEAAGGAKFRAVIVFESELSLNPFGERLMPLSAVPLPPPDPSVFSLIEMEKEQAKLVTREALATVVYTSGTTGTPKGVMQTHQNHLTMLEGVTLSELAGTGRGMFLFLPMAHSFARLISFSGLATGGDLVFPSVVDRMRTRFDSAQIFSDARDAKIEIFPSVPRLFERVMASFQTRQPRSFSERAAQWAVNLLSSSELGSDPSALGLHLKSVRGGALEWLERSAARLIARKVRRQLFGTKLKYAVSGGAPLPLPVYRFFKLLGITIYEGYGLTETAPAVSANTAQFHKPGSVGRPFHGLNLRINPDDGELELSGANIFPGYYKRDQETVSVFTADGWFKTGDIVRIDDEGFIFITGRKKEIIVTSGGKNIAPGPIEIALEHSALIRHAVVYGDRMPYLSALIVPEFDLLRSQQRLSAESDSVISNADIAQSAQTKAALQFELDRVNHQLGQYEKVRRFTVLAEEFTVENGLLTATLKVRRNEVLKRFLKPEKAA